MTTSTTMTQTAPTQVETTINYFPEEGGTTFYITGSPEFFNRKFTPTKVHVQDVRGRETDFSLAKQGFQWVRHASEQGDFGDEARIKEFYLPETEELIRGVTGATLVKGFSHEIRSVELSAILDTVDQQDKSNNGEKKPRKSPPAMYAHVDNGPLWANRLFQQVLTSEEATRFHGCRWAIINAWRPIRTIHRNPLGVCDPSTVLDADLVPVYAKLTPTWGNPTKDLSADESQVYNVRANPNHRWYFASAMRPDEVLLITIFDTNKTVDGVARRVVHSAFPYADEQGASPRESIEFRSLVIWEDQQAEEAK